jgi:membrane protein
MWGVLSLIYQAAIAFAEDHAMTLAAALAFYAALSLAPIIVVLLWLSSFLGEDSQYVLVAESIKLMGAQAGETIAMVLANARAHPSLGSFAGWLSLAIMLISASAVFVQLQTSLNRIWKVESAPKFKLLDLLKKRLVSIGMVLSMGVLMVVSLFVSAIISFSLTFFSEVLGTGTLRTADMLGTLFTTTILFATIFRILPDTKILWRQVWIGAAITATLFTLGKAVIAVYLGQTSLASPYGAAGSLVILLLWLYYSAVILFFGAEITHVFATQRDRQVSHVKYS